MVASNRPCGVPQPSRSLLSTARTLDVCAWKKERERERVIFQHSRNRIRYTALINPNADFVQEIPVHFATS